MAKVKQEQVIEARVTRWSLGANNELSVVKTTKEQFNLTILLAINGEGYEAYGAWVDAIKVAYLAHGLYTDYWPATISFKPSGNGTKAYINDRYAGLINRKLRCASVIVWYDLLNGSN